MVPAPSPLLVPQFDLRTQVPQFELTSWPIVPPPSLSFDMHLQDVTSDLASLFGGFRGIERMALPPHVRLRVATSHGWSFLTLMCCACPGCFHVWNCFNGFIVWLFWCWYEKWLQRQDQKIGVAHSKVTCVGGRWCLLDVLLVHCVEDQWHPCGPEGQHGMVSDSSPSQQWAGKPPPATGPFTFTKGGSKTYSA